jgi:transposase InsO family protein
VATLLVEEIIVRFGTPYVIHTDQGVQFESILFQEMCRLLQIQKTRTTPYQKYAYFLHLLLVIHKECP